MQPRPSEVDCGLSRQARQNPPAWEVMAMETAEFDRFADEYHDMHQRNIAITGEDPAYFSAYKIRVWSEWFSARQSMPARILDFGSGVGNSVPFFRAFFPSSQLTCADVSARSLDLARARFPGQESQITIQDTRIPAGDAEFDAVFSACVFHHIPHEQHAAWLRELWRVTVPGGAIAVFEHNPLNPLTVRAVISPRTLSARLRKAGWGQVKLSYHVFFPRAFAALRRLDRMLGTVPFGAQYAVMAIKPSS
jgi:SAM-dependent methyltransferase